MSQVIFTGSVRASEQGNSQSMSMPARPFLSMKSLALEMNLARLSEDDTIFEKYSDGKFQPPMEMITF